MRKYPAMSFGSSFSELLSPERSSASSESTDSSYPSRLRFHFTPAASSSSTIPQKSSDWSLPHQTYTVSQKVRKVNHRLIQFRNVTGIRLWGNSHQAQSIPSIFRNLQNTPIASDPSSSPSPNRLPSHPPPKSPHPNIPQ